MLPVLLYDVLYCTVFVCPAIGLNWCRIPTTTEDEGTSRDQQEAVLSAAERMCGHHIYQSMGQPGKVANPACGQRNRGNEYFLVSVRA